MLFAGILAFLFNRKRILNASKQGNRAVIKREIIWIIYIMLIAGILSQTVLPEIVINSDGIHFVFAQYGRVNTHPFAVFDLVRNDYLYGNNYSLWINFLANILLFVPFGFLQSLLSYNFFKGTFATFFLSLFIEVCQYFIGRSSDIDDLILNTVGGILGALIWFIIRKGKFALEIKKEKAIL